MKNRPFAERLGFALAGWRVVFMRERSFRSQISVGALALVTSLALQVDLLSIALLIFSIGLVLALELVNSALEYLADHLHPTLATEIGHAKDAAAGAVLVASIAAALVGGVIFFRLAAACRLFG